MNQHTVCGDTDDGETICEDTDSGETVCEDTDSGADIPSEDTDSGADIPSVGTQSMAEPTVRTKTVAKKTPKSDISKIDKQIGFDYL